MLLDGSIQGKQSNTAEVTKISLFWNLVDYFRRFFKYAKDPKFKRDASRNYQIPKLSISESSKTRKLREIKEWFFDFAESVSEQKEPFQVLVKKLLNKICELSMMKTAAISMLNKEGTKLVLVNVGAYNEKYSKFVDSLFALVKIVYPLNKTIKEIDLRTIAKSKIPPSYRNDERLKEIFINPETENLLFKTNVTGEQIDNLFSDEVDKNIKTVLQRFYRKQQALLSVIVSVFKQNTGYFTDDINKYPSDMPINLWNDLNLVAITGSESFGDLPIRKNENEPRGVLITDYRKGIPPDTAKQIVNALANIISVLFFDYQNKVALLDKLTDFFAIKVAEVEDQNESTERELVIKENFMEKLSRELSLKERELEEKKKLLFEEGIRIEKLSRELEENLKEKQIIQAQLRQAEKMNALGQMAGGVAHDLNNDLQVIVGCLDNILNDRLPNISSDIPAEGYADLVSSLKVIFSAASSSIDLVKKLLAFSRKGDTAKVLIDLNQKVAAACKMVERTTPKAITFNLELRNNLNYIKANPTNIEQVVVNLLTNARDAIHAEGTITVQTRNMEFRSEDSSQDADNIKPGNYILLTVMDTGCGISEKIKEHIFEPFFTTKEIGKGTGLGLSIVYGIVKDHEGYIACESKPDEGSTFKIYLPALLNVHTLPAMDNPIQNSSEDLLSLRGTETVLVVDDKETIRDIYIRVLKSQGYRVHAAENGQKALERYSSFKDLIDLIILDLDMPVMDGKTCLRKILELQEKDGNSKRVKVIIATGYGKDAQLDALAVDGVIQKPATNIDIARTVRKVLGNNGSKVKNPDSATLQKDMLPRLPLSPVKITVSADEQEKCKQILQWWFYADKDIIHELNNVIAVFLSIDEDDARAQQRFEKAALRLQEILENISDEQKGTLLGKFYKEAFNTLFQVSDKQHLKDKIIWDNRAFLKRRFNLLLSKYFHRFVSYIKTGLENLGSSQTIKAIEAINLEDQTAEEFFTVLLEGLNGEGNNGNRVQMDYIGTMIKNKGGVIQNPEEEALLYAVFKNFLSSMKKAVAELK